MFQHTHSGSPPYQVCIGGNFAGEDEKGNKTTWVY